MDTLRQDGEQVVKIAFRMYTNTTANTQPNNPYTNTHNTKPDTKPSTKPNTPHNNPSPSYLSKEVLPL
ncbi:MAG: hypothetical protein K0U52_11185, partial [Gammaproteobacteria bacterium]|nr:hypothetical protein [Gammaproteobacteria bacterium]